MLSSEMHVNHRLLPVDGLTGLSATTSPSVQDLTPALVGKRRDESWFATSDYLKESAQRKMADLWLKITETKDKSGVWPGTWTIAKAFLNLDVSFEEKGDTWKSTWWGRSREKALHSVGATGKVKWIPYIKNA